MAQQRQGKFRMQLAIGGYQSECGDKTRWGSEQSAQRAIARLRREYPDAFDSTVRPFRCTQCRRWHGGHWM